MQARVSRILHVSIVHVACVFPRSEFQVVNGAVWRPTGTKSALFRRTNTVLFCCIILATAVFEKDPCICQRRSAKRQNAHSTNSVIRVIRTSAGRHPPPPPEPPHHPLRRHPARPARRRPLRAAHTAGCPRPPECPPGRSPAARRCSCRRSRGGSSRQWRGGSRRRLGLYPIVTLEKQVLNVIGNLV